MVTTWKIINYKNGKNDHCKNILSLRIDNEEILNQNSIANIFNSYFLSIAESLKSGNNLFIYLAGCTMFPHLPAPIWQL